LRIGYGQDRDYRFEGRPTPVTLVDRLACSPIDGSHDCRSVAGERGSPARRYFCRLNWWIEKAMVRAIRAGSRPGYVGEVVVMARVLGSWQEERRAEMISGGASGFMQRNTGLY
jgi:hypothetical protein